MNGTDRIYPRQTTITWEKALTLIEKNLPHPKVSAQAVTSIMETLKSDLLAPRMGACSLEVGVTEFSEEPEVLISFGGREWQFNAQTGELIGSETFLGEN